MSTLPSSAQVVVIGGGVMGASTAYHLALRGMRDVVLLESQSFFGQGATGKCAGGIRYQFSTAINIRLSQISLPMLNRFEDETGQFIDLRYPGYMLLATTEENIAEFKRNIELQHSLGVPTEWLSQDEVRRRAPQIVADDVLAATFHGGDGLVILRQCRLIEDLSCVVNEIAPVAAELVADVGLADTAEKLPCLLRGLAGSL